MGVSGLSEISPRNIRVAIFRKKFDFEVSVYSRSSCLVALGLALQALSRMFDLDLFGVLPLSPESRLRAKNLGKSLFEVAPRDPLAAKLRQLADSLCVTRGERRSLLSWLGRAKAALL